MVTTKKFLAFIFLLTLFHPNISRAQQSILPIYELSKIYINALEKEEFEIVHIGYNILTATDKSEDSRRNFHKSYEYVIAAYGDENIKKIKVELFKSVNSKWELVKEGQAFDKNDYISYLSYKPTETASFLIEVTAVEFEIGKSSGRFFVAIGNKENLLTLTTSKREEMEYNTKNKKVKNENIGNFNSTFTLVNEMFIHNYSSYTVNYTITENLTTDADIKDGLYLYNVENEYKTAYTIMIDTVNKTILVMKKSPKKDHILTGHKYYFTGNF